jgi:hypothetical protein
MCCREGLHDPGDLGPLTAGNPQRFCQGWAPDFGVKHRFTGGDRSSDFPSN